MATAVAEQPSLAAVPPSASPPAEMGSPAWKDVWTRSTPTYRFRAVALLLLDIALFAGVGSFAYWLRTGDRFAPLQGRYWDELRDAFGSVGILGKGSVSLGSLLSVPINVQDVPMQIPILGLLMAALISVPILVAILYRFRSCLPFIAVVAFIAVMPWLALTLLASCILASVRPFRTPFRFMSALLGLWPAAAYLILAWLGTTDAIAGRIDPVDRIKFVAPWVLAIVAATVAFATVLTLAKMVDYRPGAIAPTLALMLALPVGLFEYHVGRDELYYRLLEARNKTHFADVDASLDLDEAVASAWARRGGSGRTWRAIRETVETRWLFGLTADLTPDRSALAEHQAELTRQCDEFLKYFPDSAYAANALYIKARALDMRVDAGEFRRTRWIRFYDDFPSPASMQAWRLLAENHPQSLPGAVAMLRLAQLEARNGHVERAIERLTNIRSYFGASESGPAVPTATAGSAALKHLLTRQAPDVGLAVPRERIILEAERLYTVLTANRDPIYGDEPLSGPRGEGQDVWFGLMDLDSRHERYVQNLEALLAVFPRCQLKDNLELEIAKASTPAPVRAENLRRHLEKYPDQDSSDEALFRLALAQREMQEWEQSDATFNRLLRDHPDSIWARQAMAHRLRRPPAQLSEGR